MFKFDSAPEIESVINSLDEVFHLGENVLVRKQSEDGKFSDLGKNINNLFGQRVFQIIKIEECTSQFFECLLESYICGLRDVASGETAVLPLEILEKADN